MSNRQARREQSRQPRQQRTPTGRRPAPGRTPPGKSGGGPDIFSLPYLLAVGALIVVMAVVLAIVVARTGGGNDELVSNLEKAQANLPLDLAKGTKLGKDDAPVKLTVYEDFQCPFCLEYTAGQEGGLIEEFVKTGQMQMEFKNLAILGRGESVKAAEAGLCAADQDKFWQYHNVIFLVQAKADQIGNEKVDVGRLSDANLKKYASDVGLDKTKFDTCLDSSLYLEKVSQQQAEAKSFGINGTPGFLVNGTPLGAGTPSDLDAWRELIAKVIDFVNATPTPGGSTTPAATASTAPAATTAATATATKAP
jgi:protein-disulfide isomerase